MAVFAVIATEPSPELEASVKEHFPHDHLSVGPSDWLVAGNGIAREISEKLGVAPGGINNAIVLSISGYWGIANNSIWEWIALKLTLGAAKDV